MNWNKFATLLDGVIAYINYDYNKQKDALEIKFAKDVQDGKIQDLKEMTYIKKRITQVREAIEKKSWWQPKKTLNDLEKKLINSYNNIYLKHFPGANVTDRYAECYHYYKVENKIFDEILLANNVVKPYYDRSIIRAKLIVIYENLENYTFEQILEIVTKDGKY